MSKGKSSHGTTNSAFERPQEEEQQQETSAANAKPVPTIETFDAKHMEQAFGYKELQADNAFKSTGTYLKKYYRPSGDCLLNFFFHRFPFFGWIRTYNIKEDLAKDLVGGLTLGVVHIPQ
jgi:hypothetical protein